MNTIITTFQLELIEKDITGIQGYTSDIEEWEEEEADTIFDYYHYRDSDDRPQEILNLWFDELNNKAIYCYTSL